MYGTVACTVDREDRRVGLYLRDAQRHNASALLTTGTAATLAACLDAAARDVHASDATFDGHTIDGEAVFTVDRDGPKVGLYVTDQHGDGFECVFRVADVGTLSAALWAACKDHECADLNFAVGGTFTAGAVGRGGHTRAS